MRVVGAPTLGMEQAGGKHWSWGGQVALQGVGEGAGPGRLALRGRVAHRVLVSTKSLQRRRTRVLLLFSYLQEPEVTGTDTKLCTPRQGYVTPWRHPRLSPMYRPQGTRNGNPLQPWSLPESSFSHTPTSFPHTSTLDLNQGIKTKAQETRRFWELPGGTLGLQSKSIHQDVSATRSSNKGQRTIWVYAHLEVFSIPLPLPESQGGLALPL